MIGNDKEDDSVFIIHVQRSKEEIETKNREEAWNTQMHEPPKNAVHPEGSIYPFHWLLRCFAKRTLLSDNRYYDVFCNNFVYTTDGRMFMGHYIPGEDMLEDLDPFVMIPADYIFCCGCCCPSCFGDD